MLRNVAMSNLDQGRDFFCKYREPGCEEMTEVVQADSADTAKLLIQIEHPLAKLTAKPVDLSKVSNGGFMRKMLTLIVIGGLVFGGVVVFVFFHGNSASTTDKAPSGNVVQENILPAQEDASISKKADKIVSAVKEKVKILSKPISSSSIKPQEIYSRAYHHIVSIRTDNSTSTGFKLRTDGRVYLYTCQHCIEDFTPIVARDAENKVLNLGNMEMCSERDLVRFTLPEEKDGFELANIEKLKIDADVMAYGDTSGGGVMTQNKGKILGVGRNKIEIDAAVLQGNSGGPVLNDDGMVVGVVSMATVNKTIWAKDTRYEKVRRYAERADGGLWVAVGYRDFLKNYAFMHDTYEMTCEMHEFLDKLKKVNGLKDRVSFTVNILRYKGDFGYAECIRKMYETWNEMATEERKISNVLKETDKSRFEQDQLDAFYEKMKSKDALFRQAYLTIPINILSFASSHLRALNICYFRGSIDALLDEIEKNLSPVISSHEKLCDECESDSQKIYQSWSQLIEKRKDEDWRRQKRQEEIEDEKRRRNSKPIWGYFPAK